MSFFYIINSIVYLSAITNLIKYFYPEKYDTCMNSLKCTFTKLSINAGYQLIYYYSKIQLCIVKIKITFNKFIKYYTTDTIDLMDVLKEYFLSDFFYYNNNDEFLYYIKDGQIIDSCFTHLIEKKKDISYDFLLYIHGINGILNKNIPSCLDYQHTNYKFIQIMIELNNKHSFEIHLSNSEYNYYIVNNIIDSYFILYFLRTHYTNKVSNYENEFLLNYSLNVIDNNIILLTIDNTDVITFDVDDYYLTKCNCKEECNEIDKDECKNNYECSECEKIEVSKKNALLLEAENRKITELMFSSDSKIDSCLENIVDNDFIMDY